MRILFLYFLFTFSGLSLANENYRAPAVEPWMEVDESTNNRPRHLPSEVPTYNFSPSKSAYRPLGDRPSPLLFIFMMVIFPLSLWMLTLALLKRPNQDELNQEVLRLKQTKKRRGLKRKMEEHEEESAATRKKAS